MNRCLFNIGDSGKRSFSKFLLLLLHFCLGWPAAMEILVRGGLSRRKLASWKACWSPAESNDHWGESGTALCLVCPYWNRHQRDDWWWEKLLIKLKLPAAEQRGIPAWLSGRRFRQGLSYCVVRLPRGRADGECAHRNSKRFSWNRENQKPLIL